MPGKPNALPFFHFKTDIAKRPELSLSQFIPALFSVITETISSFRELFNTCSLEYFLQTF